MDYNLDIQIEEALKTYMASGVEVRWTTKSSTSIPL